MSRRIENDHLWTDDEVKYQLSRGRKADVEQNKKDFSHSSNPVVSEDDSPALKLDTDIFEAVKSMNLETLQSEHRKRGLVPAGDEKALKVSLAQLLQTERDEEKGGKADA